MKTNMLDKINDELRVEFGMRRIPTLSLNPELKHK
jgi:hypothetical protein